MTLLFPRTDSLNSMKYCYAFIILLMATTRSAQIQAQAAKPDSLFFNLYTDSLKKGTYNYINVDAHFSNGRWLPMTDKDLLFQSSAGRFEGNSLYLDRDTNVEKVSIKAILKADTSILRQVVIYVKKLPDNEKLKRKEDLY